jgi:hypothetical protein
MRIAASIHWYQQGAISMEPAAEFADMSRPELLAELARRKSMCSWSTRRISPENFGMPDALIVNAVTLDHGCRRGFRSRVAEQRESSARRGEEHERAVDGMGRQTRSGIALRYRDA